MTEQEAWQVTDDAAVLYEQSFVPAIFARSAACSPTPRASAAGDRVLDVGCGTGVVAREAARRVGAEGRVVGLDLNPRMLAVAGASRPRSNGGKGDAGDLPFEDGAFDVVVSQFALMFFPDPRAGAARDVARPGAARPARGRRLRPARGRAGLRGAAAESPRGAARPEVVELLRSPFALGDRERLAELVRAAGIEGAEVQTLRVPGALPLDRCSGAHRGQGVADPGRHRRSELRCAAGGRAPAPRAAGAATARGSPLPCPPTS